MYWSRCESFPNMYEGADVKPQGCVPESIVEISPNSSYTYFTEEGFKNQTFNKCYYNRMYATNGRGGGSRYFHPFAYNNLNWKKGTLSVWVRSLANSTGDWWCGSYGQAMVSFITSSASNCFSVYTDFRANKDGGGLYAHSLNVKIYGTVVSSLNINNGQIYHLYMVWDFDKGLSNGKSVRIFLDGSEVITLDNDLPQELGSIVFENICNTYAVGSRALIGGANGEAEVSIDNIKIWNQVVSEDDPSWEFQNPYDDGLHPIYGVGNRFRPVLTKSDDNNNYNDGGVGYYYIPRW
jgi:hypothetical protein